MLITELLKGQRYLFYYNNGLVDDGVVTTYMFRANFVTITNLSIILDKYCIGGEVQHGFWAMPIDWIEHIETLEEITNSKTILPNEILVEIDNFLT
jgi:hypothetical protein